MPPNARWESSKIVIPSVPNQEEKLIGGLKNALDRGETLAKAKQSLINAGYKPAEITAAAQKIPTATPVIGKQVAAPSEAPSETQVTNPLPTNSEAIQSKKLSKKLVIILISISAIILIGAVVLGLFWDTVF